MIATALAAFECPTCGEVVEVSIPVLIEVTEDRIAARVDDSATWEQPAWDHALTAHGPHL